MLKRLSNPHFSSRPFIVTGPNAPIDPSDSASQQPPSSNAPRPRPIRSNGPKCTILSIQCAAAAIIMSTKQPVQSDKLPVLSNNPSNLLYLPPLPLPVRSSLNLHKNHHQATRAGNAKTAAERTASAQCTTLLPPIASLSHLRS